MPDDDDPTLDSTLDDPNADTPPVGQERGVLRLFLKRVGPGLFHVVDEADSDFPHDIEIIAPTHP